MEQRISYTLGFDLATVDPTRTPVISGGFFGLDSNVPSALRGDTEGFYAAMLIRPRISPYRNIWTAGGTQFLAGSYDFANELGWAFMLDSGLELDVVVGDATVEYDFPEGGEDYLVLVVYDGSSIYLYVNGMQVESDTLVSPFGLGPDNFGIGGTSDPSFLAALGTEAFGAVSCHIGGVAVGPFPGNLMDLGFTSSPAAEQYAAVYSALDVVDPGSSPVPGGVTLPPATNLWSTRRGLPELVDGGREIWADEVDGVELSRIGAKTGASVSNVAANWGAKVSFLDVEPT